MKYLLLSVMLFVLSVVSSPLSVSASSPQDSEVPPGILVPDPTTPPPGISELSGPNLFVEDGVPMLAYLYAANTVATTPSNGPLNVDCSSVVTIKICAANFERVTGWSNWSLTDDGQYVILHGLPAGIQQFSIISRHAASLLGPVSWQMQIDTGSTLSGAVAGVTCGANAVAFLGVETSSAYDFNHILLLFGLLLFSILFSGLVVASKKV